MNAIRVFLFVADDIIFLSGLSEKGRLQRSVVGRVQEGCRGMEGVKGQEMNKRMEGGGDQWREKGGEREEEGERGLSSVRVVSVVDNKREGKRRKGQRGEAKFFPFVPLLFFLCRESSRPMTLLLPFSSLCWLAFQCISFHCTAPTKQTKGEKSNHRQQERGLFWVSFMISARRSFFRRPSNHQRRRHTTTESGYLCALFFSFILCFLSSFSIYFCSVFPLDPISFGNCFFLSLSLTLSVIATPWNTHSGPRGGATLVSSSNPKNSLSHVPWMFPRLRPSPFFNLSLSWSDSFVCELFIFVVHSSTFAH